MNPLPEIFLRRMKTLLGGEYEQWLYSYEQPPCQGLRINLRKLTPPQWEKLSPYGTERVPWTENGYYCGGDSRPARDPYYYGGLYYVQEPSAMAPAALLQVKPGDRVLDLCAAPGGKSTELGARLEGRGILVANDLSVSRARALVKNLELAGIENMIVTAESPQRLLAVFGPFFDKILVDAPCSGEGMFRKEPELIRSWTERGPEYYAPLQREILSCAVKMLRPGGELVYSTCTFSEEEDEAVIGWILREDPELEPVPLVPWEGAAGGIHGEPVIRLFPHRVKGEGHFAAKLRRRGGGGQSPAAKTEQSLAAKTGQNRAAEIEQNLTTITDQGIAGREIKEKSSSVPARPGRRDRFPKGDCRFVPEDSYREWERFLVRPFPRERLMVRDGQVYCLPEELDRLPFRIDPACDGGGFRGLRFLRTGLLLGTLKKGRFEPSQAAALALKEKDYSQTCSFKREDERVIRYLKGETVVPDGGAYEKGWVLICVDGFPLGWARYAGGVFKNKYYPGWRWQ